MSKEIQDYKSQDSGDEENTEELLQQLNNEESYDSFITPPPTELTYSRSTGLEGSQVSASHHRKSSNDNMLSAQLSQWTYNNNKATLHKAINQAEGLLEKVVAENSERPMFLIDEQEVKKLHVLQPHLKLEGTYTVEHDKSFNLDRAALAKLFHSQVQVAKNHLHSLKTRVDDVSSKVFVTGDVNTGKSAFCNSLLRRSLLPEDQLPCTNVFCEVLESRDNNNIEEVHAIPHSIARSIKEIPTVYSIKKTTTYERHPLSALPDLVQRNDKYLLLKIYIKDDKTTPEKSLLRNGIVDISLLDSPGLNMDSLQTTEVMARQEEIDLVIFVVNAENQLTLSAKEFISLASTEKKFMFFVVKKFDKIRDKQRCKDLILKQIKDLSPESHKRANEFVHFLSSPEHDILGPNGGGGGDPGDDGDSPYHNNDPDFDNLQSSLRNFLLKKRSLSKLLPAKTYLIKLLSDVETISEGNLKSFKQEDDNISKELEQLEPEISEVQNTTGYLTMKAEHVAENSIYACYEFTSSQINAALDISFEDLPSYQGISRIHDFIFSTEQYIKDRIKSNVIASEQFAKMQTAKTVSELDDLGKSKLGDDFMKERTFQSELMFTKRLHLNSKKLNIRLSVTDLFAPSWSSFIQYIGWSISFPFLVTDKKQEKVISDSTEETAVSNILEMKNYPLTQYLSRPSLLFTSRLPAMAIYSFGGTKILSSIAYGGLRLTTIDSLKKIAAPLLVVGSLLGVAYLIHDLPRALPVNLVKKYRKKLGEINFAHQNAERITKEVRIVLKVPIREIYKSCEAAVEKKQSVKRDLEIKRANNALSITFFNKLIAKAQTQKTIVQNVNLDID
ncbi:Mitofusin FZO1 [Nakaseomyces bracarensis]|uniref:Mitofusin FZO1 n=1 Tax=Nakaseomyces bracarensis TaxID=273131 RepID=A0ABR4P113_9SACH